MNGAATFEELDPLDLVGAVESVKITHAVGRLSFPPADGQPPDTLISWAVSEIGEAAEALDRDTRLRKATNAVVIARRSLSCVVDWYLRRDGFAFCRNAPKDAGQTTDVLKSRGIMDDLTARVWKRLVVDTRNGVEHAYVAMSIQRAEDAVEVTRRSMQAMMSASDPRVGPCLFGWMNMSVTFGGDGERAEFQGWRDPSVLVAAFADPPWIGIVLPATPDRATVRRAFLRDLDVAIYAAALRVLEGRCWPPSGAYSETVWVRLSDEAGLGLG